MADGEREKWNARYRAAGAEAPAPARVLSENAHLLPARGEALDLACGLGGNALLLAGRGLHTAGWDIADAALERLRGFAAAAALDIATERRDVSARPPAPHSYDVIVVSRFLDRALAPALAAALRPGGLLFYQTFLRDSPGAAGPRCADYRLATNELLRLFPTLTVLVYREEGMAGDLGAGWREEALFVGQADPRRLRGDAPAPSV